MESLSFGLGGLEAEFWRWLFIMTRIGAALFAAPFFGATSVPPQARVIMTGAVGAWRPQGSISRGGERPAAAGDYEAWTPE